jgi:adenine/guanine/hypoxanthine permease
MLVCMTGLVPTVLHWVPLAVVAMVIVWFGLVMVGQAFQEVSKEHCVAVALGLVPILAAWALQTMDLALHKGGSNLFDSAPKFGDELAIYGMIALSQGWLLVSMLWAVAWMFDRRFLHAALWLMVGSVLSCFGVVHAYTITAQGVENRLWLWVAPAFTISYAAGALFLVACHFYAARTNAAFAVSD